LTKEGSGTFTLTGNNTYSGSTTVRNGTLAVNSGGSINHSSANLTVGLSSGDNATLSIGSGGSVSAFRGLLGFDGGATGTLSVSGGNLTLADELYVGTTGNGVLNLSTLDGWWAEGYELDNEAGWRIGPLASALGDDDTRRIDAEDLYTQLQFEVIHEYEYPERARWIRRMKRAIGLMGTFNAQRCIEEYKEKAWGK
jgi:autotransporter-associated beta strand protein/T5SS/PEP-CTERM-associated repeat protein